MALVSFSLGLFGEGNNNNIVCPDEAQTCPRFDVTINGKAQLDTTPLIGGWRIGDIQVSKNLTNLIPLFSTIGPNITS